MNRWQRFLFDASRSQRFLWRFTIAMLMGGIAVGYLASRFIAPSPELLADRIAAIAPGSDSIVSSGDNARSSDEVLKQLEHEVADPNVELGDIIDSVPTLADILQHDEDLDKVFNILSGRFSDDEANLVVDYLTMYGQDEPDKDAADRLTALADETPPLRFANHALGMVALDRENFVVAAMRFEREGEFPEANDSRSLAVHALIQGGDLAGLDRLRGDARYAGLITAHDSLDIAVTARDWRGILKWTPISQWSGFDPAILVVGLVAGFAWAFFLGHLGEFPAFLSKSSLICGAAFVCGVVSTTLTLYAAIWQDDILHFSEDGGVLRQFIYFIGAVGVREELSKVLLFLPLVPILLKRDDELEALMAASFVGLGFAIEENGNYFMATHAAGATGRFLTANFLHVVLTGVNGLYLYRVFTHGLAALGEFLTVFGVTILAHGFYDALLGLPDAGAGNYLAMGVYVGVSMLYFNRAHQLRTNTRMTISLSGAFVFGLTSLTAAVIIYEMITLGPQPGLRVFAPELLGSGVLLVMFFREFNEQLAH